MRTKDLSNKTMTQKDKLIQLLDHYDYAYFINERDAIIIIYHVTNISEDVRKLIAQNGYALQSP